MTETTTLRDAALAAAHDSARKAREQRATERGNHGSGRPVTRHTHAASLYRQRYPTIPTGGIEHDRT